MKRLIAIADIHGEIEKLNSVLTKLHLQKDDTVIFLGDYIDRGQHPKAVIERLIELSKTTNCIFLKGNHEDMLLNTLETKSEDDITHWLLSGGITTYDDYGDFPAIFNTHGEFLKNLQPYYLTDEYLFVHAGINPQKALEEQILDDLLWIREDFYNNSHNLKQKIIFGHTTFKEPFIDKDKIGIALEQELELIAYICDENTFVTSSN